MFEWYASGLESYTSIADKLNGLGYRTLDWRTGQQRLFGRESVRTILRNRAYCGYTSSGGIEYTGVHPPLVSEALWATVNRLRSERTLGGGVVKVAPVDTWVLQGLVYCAECGAKMWIHPSGPRRHRQRNYLCSGRSRRTCVAPYVHADPIETAMRTLLGHIQIMPELEAELLAETRALFDKDVPRPRVDRAKLEEQLRRVGQLYADEVIGEAEYVKRRDALKAQLATAQATPTSDFNLEEAIALLKAFPTFVHDASAAGLRDMLRAVFSHVWAAGKTITAVTPKGVYLPLFATLWKSSLGCPTGFEPATS
jgi:hypothetical protein